MLEEDGETDGSTCLQGAIGMALDNVVPISPLDFAESLPAPFDAHVAG